MWYMAISLLLGMALHYFWVVKLSNILLLLVIITIFLLCLKYRTKILIAVMAFMLGFAWLQLNIEDMHDRNSVILPWQKDILVVGEVIKLPDIQECLFAKVK